MNCKPQLKSREGSTGGYGCVSLEEKGRIQGDTSKLATAARLTSFHSDMLNMNLCFISRLFYREIYISVVQL